MTNIEHVSTNIPSDHSTITDNTNGSRSTEHNLTTEEKNEN